MRSGDFLAPYHWINAKLSDDGAAIGPWSVALRSTSNWRPRCRWTCAGKAGACWPAAWRTSSPKSPAQGAVGKPGRWPILA